VIAVGNKSRRINTTMDPLAEPRLSRSAMIIVVRFFQVIPPGDMPDDVR